jgi:hypothetical protein
VGAGLIDEGQARAELDLRDSSVDHSHRRFARVLEEMDGKILARELSRYRKPVNLVDRGDKSAEKAACLEQGHEASETGCMTGRRQAGEAAADDRDFR